MPTCQFCGKETPQPDAAYCSYCGSSLRQAQSGASAAPAQAQSPQGSYAVSGSSSFDGSQRYEKVLVRVERLGLIVVILSMVALILLII